MSVKLLFVFYYFKNSYWYVKTEYIALFQNNHEI